MNLSNNLIQSLDVFNVQDSLNFLLELDLSNNKISELSPIQLRCLKKINLCQNKIVSCERFEGHSTLETIELRRNELSSLKGI